jgi:Mg2+-importing ATPase
MQAQRGGIEKLFWTTPLDKLYRALDAVPGGLEQADAKARLSRYGANTTTAAERIHLGLRIVKRLFEPLIVILLVAAAISGFTGDVASCVIVMVVIGVSVALDLFQEGRACQAAEALRRSVAIQADVRRDGRLVVIPVEDIVPGDVVELRAGDLVPADGVLISGRNVHVNEALMTGEPFPADKKPGVSESSQPAEAFNALFAGTSVVGGEATMLAVATGSETRFGGIATALSAAPPPSSLERGIRHLSFLILRLTIFLTLFVLLAQVVFGRPPLESFLFALAIAVGLTPELLPMIMTVTLARGAMRMATERVVVKRLAAIHDLGAMDVLCTDKTGTLTEAKITLASHIAADGQQSDRVLTLAGLNSLFESGIRSPFDDAVRARCDEKQLRSWRKLDEVPFDFERRGVSVLAEREGERILILKGAPESVLARTSSIERGDGTTRPLDAPMRAELERILREQSELGYRLLGVAWKSMPERQAIKADDEQQLVFAGYCCFLDPPKETGAQTIARLTASGIRVKVLSGDHEAVVRHIAVLLNMPVRGLLSGREIAELTDAALIARVDDVDLFARVAPDQKTRIIRALQARGHIVGFIGDGVNDAPAIRAAEIGLSVEGATDVARSAADMILLDKDLGVLADGVEEGRRTLTNILKYVRMGTSSNFGNMLSMAAASLMLPFLPLLPVQILFNNLLYDLSETGIPFDRVDPEDVASPHAWDIRDILRFTLIMGALSSLFDLAVFAALLWMVKVNPDVFRTAWFVESTLTQILVIFAIRTGRRFWASRISLVLTATSLGAIAASLVVVFTPLGRVLGFVTIPGSIIVVIAALVAGYLIAAEIAKAWACPCRPSGKHGGVAELAGRGGLRAFGLRAPAGTQSEP